jgi:cytochrome c55X
MITMRARRQIGWAVAFALSAGILCTVAWPAMAQDAPAADAREAGRKLYINACQRCHGINLVTTGIGFDLRTFPQAEKERFVRSVTNGLRAMPAWGNTMKSEQIELIWGYIGSVNGWPATPTSQ